MTTKEASDILCVVPASVARYCRDGKLKAVKIKHGLRDEWEINSEDIKEFKEKYY